MAQTYKQIQKQIEQLQRKADALRHSEINGVVERIKVAIAHYGLTAAHLGLASASTGRKPSAAKSRAKASKAQFSDGAGDEWSGRGPRPRWLREALAAGRSIEEFRTAASAPAAAAPAAKAGRNGAAKKGVKRAKRAPSKVNYTDGEGHSWTGRGPMPKWLKTAIEGGKTLQDFAH